MTDCPRIPASEIALMAEMTTSSGPLVEDHLLAVVSRSGRLLEWPMHEVIGSQWLDDCEGRLGVKLDIKLANSVALRTRIIYPACLREHPLLAEKPWAPGVRTILRAIRCFGVIETETAYTDEVKSYLAALPAPR